MKTALRRLFPSAYEVLSEWPIEMWAMLPLALVMLICPSSAMVYGLFVYLGWIADAH